MPKYNKRIYKQYISKHKIEQLINKLLQEIDQYITAHKQSTLEHTYGDLIILSGKWESIQQEEKLGIAEAKTIKIEKNRIIKAALDIINNLPNDFFDFLNRNKKPSIAVTPDSHSQIEKVHQDNFFNKNGKKIGFGLLVLLMLIIGERVIPSMLFDDIIYNFIII